MRRAKRTTGTFGVACLGLVGCAGIAGIVTGLNARSVRAPDVTPLEIISDRFAALAPATTTPVVYSPAARTAALETPRSSDAELFSPRPFYPLQAPQSPAAPAEEAAPQPSAAIPDGNNIDNSKVTIAKAESTHPQAAAHASALHPKSTGRPGGVLNDAQIANIKHRLKLTPDQESMWPPVEMALRNITYTKGAADPRLRAAQPGSAMAYIDPNSDEVRQLKYAALPLIMRLDDDQRREVKAMAHVMGLESVTSQF